ncbi:restriction endonuclease subunit S [Nostoc sp.]|uniref:restriction endonuclease subunit S n=1 Tax=Nostoc sp. TaxID=1180 RepID=UPI002FF44BDB
MHDVLVENEEFKDSPLGKIPKDWEVCAIENKLQQIIDYRGKTPEKTNSGVPLITAKNVRDGYLDPEPREYIDETNYDIWMRRGFPKAEDVLFTTEAPLGNVARVPSYKIALAQRLLTLRASPEALDAGYLFWLLNWSESRRRLEQKSTGSTVLGIKQSVFRKIFFRFPSLSKQRRIAEILDTVDEAIARTSSLIIKLKHTKAGLLQDLLTCGLDDDGKLRDLQAHPEQFKDSPLGQIPKDWGVVQLSEVTTIENGTTPSREEYKFWNQGTIPWLTTGKVHERIIIQSDEFITNFALQICSLRLLPVGTILVAMIGQGITRGKVAYLAFEAAINQNFGAILPCYSFNCKFLFHYLDVNYEYVRGSSQGSNQQALNCSVVGKLQVICPPIDEQNAISTVIDSYDTHISTEEAYLNKLKLQKQGLMQDLLTGKVRVSTIK